MTAGIVVACALGFAAAPSTEAADDVAVLLERLRRPKTIRARFEQTKRHRAFRTPQTARGRVLLARPDRLRFTYEAPYRTDLVRVGNTVRIHYPALGRTQAFDLSKDGDLKAVFDVLLFFVDASPARLAGRFAVEARGSRTLRLTPKGKAETVVSRIDVTVDDDEDALSEVILTQPDGSTSTWRFFEVRVDAPIDPEAFRLGP